MVFFDYPAESFAPDSAFYYGVMLVNVPMGKDFEYEEYWNIEKITSPRPIVYHLVRSDDYEDLMMEIVPDVVIETNKDYIKWYFMYEEDFDYENQ